MPYSYVLTDDEKRELLRIARATLREYFHTGRIPPGKPHRDSLTAEAGAFVSLHKGDELRGCIGTQQESTALFRTIQEMTIAAASRDPRFEPIEEDEIEELKIEISVLAEAEPVSSAADVEIGQHGLAIECDGKRGLLLPQVASKAGLDSERFLAEVCTKAGLPEDAWRSDGASLSKFSAQVFSDATHPPLRSATLH
ncbi:AmmeMemoRadiSam system protein A [Haliangium ochraceum]|uniref:AMMECR1 domain protein n=1 Tax=Haliangium ochraceum (strain DSM 14365 / JCM 11303 / SMP-2) TaxID=502025 RepID=D0LKU7_HALO1|nr:AmmeMemoRadiSam system protein A [Haliangium ochraceum]ACY16667.1 AMMECR1 domain protein [Haliangium ochraceum DSM 14365]